MTPEPQSSRSRLTHPLRGGDQVTLVNGEVHTLTRNSEGDFEGNTPYYRWDENGEIAHAAMSYEDNRYEIVRHVETTATGTALAEDEAFLLLKELAEWIDREGPAAHGWEPITKLVNEAQELVKRITGTNSRENSITP